MTCDWFRALKAASGLRDGEPGAGEAQGQTPGAGREVLQGLGGAKQSLGAREGTAEAGTSAGHVDRLELD